ncbi:uncharacterized protein LOC105421496 [Amborella trichopoda]|uniref:uncharacterized protein LOC105421496 n=1 Tax=Amborella trichopoda TaxID=13333 RepID=UPI0005D3B790|nr:uncharacterized protein LOC105421496 [Amborella trichopoda]|eukprot:XP_011627311.1 uncharacterized protein LOC105421496 [Amborella trichopoda]
MTQMIKDNMPAPVASGPGHLDSCFIEKFKKLGPPIFKGHGGMEKAKWWQMQVEKIFRILQCTDEQQLRLGTYILKGDAEHWWHSVQQAWEEMGIASTWEEFLGAFNEKYFLDSVKERKEVEFIELQQGKLTVERYTAKFSELSRYARHIIDMEARKESKFERGLRPDIQGRVMAANLKTFSPLADLVRKIERDCN